MAETFRDGSIEAQAVEAMRLVLEEFPDLFAANEALIRQLVTRQGPRIIQNLESDLNPSKDKEERREAAIKWLAKWPSAESK